MGSVAIEIFSISPPNIPPYFTTDWSGGMGYILTGDK